MKLAMVFLFCVFNLMAQSNAEYRLNQLTSPEYLSDQGSYYTPTTGGGISMSVVSMKTEACELEDRYRRLMNNSTGAQREAYLKEVLKYMRACSVDIFADGNEVVGFKMENESKNAINPRTAEHGSSRSFSFEFDQRNKQDINIHITENSGLTGRMSHDLLETKIVFVPRRVVPYIDMNHDQVNCAHKVILPTNEYILFDAITKEIIGGVIEEEAMDMTESRHQRKFAGLEYTGNGIMIRADRRAGTPGHTYNVSYNVNERIKDAVITHKGKECIVNKSYIWENTDNPDTTAYFKYATDQEFLDTVINPLCGWNLMMDDII